MKAVTLPQFTPGCCFICGNADRPWFLDMEQQAEFWGNIYYCSECCVSIAAVLQLGDVSALSARVKQLEDVATELFDKVEAYESALAVLKSVNIEPSTIDRSVLAHQDYDFGSPEIGVSVVPRESRFVESSDDEGMAELPASDSLSLTPDIKPGW